MERPEMRIMHTEGLTSICHSEDGSWIASGGSEGDVRLLKTFDDDDRSFSCGSEPIYAVACANGKVFVASDDCSVSAFTVPDGKPEGMWTRFSMPVYCLSVNTSASLLVAGAANFEIRLVDLTSKSVKSLTGHEAPILSLSIDPFANFLASASCDGTVRIWSVGECKNVRTLRVLKKSNDLTTAKSLCRLSWQPESGKLLAIPVENEIHLYTRSDWNFSFALKGDSSSDRSDEECHTISATAWLSNGTLIAGATVAGVISIWNVSNHSLLKTITSEASMITNLSWHQERKEILFAMMNGKVGQYVLEGESSRSTEDNALDVDLSGIFDDDDNEDDALGADRPSGMAFLSREARDADNGIDGDDEDDDDDLIPVRKRTRVQQQISDDDDDDGYNIEDDIDQRKGNDSMAVDASLLEAIKDDKKDDTKEATIVPVRPSCRCPPPTDLQRPFQPGSTPEILTSRFMAYNLIGTVKLSLEDDISLIDVEFHDVSLHHGIHLTNHLNHSMASLSSTALALASKADEETPSKLQCVHFGSWDSEREWITSMPNDENVEAIGLSDGCLAVATDKRLLRTFTLTGVQTGLVCLPGPVVSVAACDFWVLVAFHEGPGLPGDQKLGCWLLDAGKNARLKRETRLPLSSKATLSWLGFTVEGRPLSYDSKGILRILDEASGWSWQPLSNMRNHLKGLSDHYWMVGVSEANMDVRCVLCKGSTYPTTLPRPVLTTVPIVMPLCEMGTEKSQLEGESLRLKLFATDGEDKRLTSTLIKMFALACKADRDCRAFDIGTMLPNEQAIAMAITYASRMKRITLAEKLNEMAMERGESDDDDDDDEEMEEEEPYRPPLRKSAQKKELEVGSFQQIQLQRQHEKRKKEEEEEENEYSDDLEDEKRIEVDAASDGDDDVAITKTTKPIVESKVSAPKSNPFKMSQSGSASGGASVLGNIEELAADLDKKTKKSHVQEKKSEAEKKPRKRESKKKREERFALKAWVEENKETLEEKFSAATSEEDFFSKIRGDFLALDDEERQRWIEKGKEMSQDEKQKRGTKRKLGSENAKPSGQKTLSFFSESTKAAASDKLAGFSFSKK